MSLLRSQALSVPLHVCAGPSGGATTTAVLTGGSNSGGGLRRGAGAPSWGPPPGSAEDGSGGDPSPLPPGSRVVTMREGVRVATVDNFQVGEGGGGRGSGWRVPKHRRGQ